MEVWGVDFSGSRLAGRKIWVAVGCWQKGRLVVRRCAALAAAGAVAREAAYQELRDRLREGRPDRVGWDFPFSLPRSLIPEPSWTDWIARFPDRYPTPEAFRANCLRQAGGELRRSTERRARVPLCAYNLRLYHQTYYGIREVLLPLLREGWVAVWPLMRLGAAETVFVEVCPASTLKRWGLRQAYQERGTARRTAREVVAERLASVGGVMLSAPLRARLIDDPEADGLDAVLCALAAAQARLIDLPEDAADVEGRVVY